MHTARSLTAYRVWRGVCIVGACMAGGVCGRGACMAGGMYGRGFMVRGHPWQGVCSGGGACVVGGCMVGGRHGRGVCTTGDVCSRGDMRATHAPNPTEWQTLVKILPCPKLCLRAVNISTTHVLQEWLDDDLMSCRCCLHKGCVRPDRFSGKYTNHLEYWGDRKSLLQSCDGVSWWSTKIANHWDFIRTQSL